MRAKLFGKYIKYNNFNFNLKFNEFKRYIKSYFMVKGIKGIFWAYFEGYLLIAIEKFDYTPTQSDFDYIPDQNTSFKFVPITNAAIERTFFQYKVHFGANRCSFTFENININLILN